MISLYHTGNKITTIDPDYGLFGEFLFFSPEPSHYGDYVYQLDIDENTIIDPDTFFYRDDADKLGGIVKAVMNVCDCDEDEAEELLSQRAHLDDEEEDWEIQHLTGKAAKQLGYRGAMVPDEHGTSYLIDMAGKEHELIVIESP